MTVADPHYTVMPLGAIEALPVGQLARGDCLLLLWTCGWAMATGQAQAVARAWGFTPQSEMIWRKLTVNGKEYSKTFEVLEDKWAWDFWGIDK